MESRLVVVLGDQNGLAALLDEEVRVGDGTGVTSGDVQAAAPDPDPQRATGILAASFASADDGERVASAELTDNPVALAAQRRRFDLADCRNPCKVVSRATKEGILRRSFAQTADMTIEGLSAFFASDMSKARVPEALGGDLTVEKANVDDELCRAVGCVVITRPESEDGDRKPLGYMTVPSFITTAAIARGLQACKMNATLLNRHNAAAANVNPQESLFVDTGKVGCGSPSRPKAAPPTGTLGGDVHVRTMDTRSYENQATGEFLVFDNGTVVLQARLEPLARARLGVGGDRRCGGARRPHRFDAPGRPTWVDGLEADLPRGQAIAVGDSSLLRWVQGWVIAAPDGTVIRVEDSGSSGTGVGTEAAAAVQLVLVPAPGPSIGLMGNNDGDPSNEFVTRGGTQLPDGSDSDFEAFYAPGGYVDSWRIAADESLFHYEPARRQRAS